MPIHRLLFTFYVFLSVYTATFLLVIFLIFNFVSFMCFTFLLFTFLLFRVTLVYISICPLLFIFYMMYVYVFLFYYRFFKKKCWRFHFYVFVYRLVSTLFPSSSSVLFDNFHIFFDFYLEFMFRLDFHRSRFRLTETGRKPSDRFPPGWNGFRPAETMKNMFPIGSDR